MEEVCMYSKFGYCHFRDRCHRRHYNEVCQNPEACKSTKLVKSDIQKAVRNTINKKVVDLEVNVPITTKKTKMSSNPVSASLN